MNEWVIKARERLTDGSEGWHWNQYLSGREARFNWGGPNWIRSSYSKKLIREDIAKGDLAVCYQVDDPGHGRAILGITRLASKGKDSPAGSGDFNCFDLISARRALRLETPLTIPQLYENDCRPKCLGPGMQGTVFPISSKEFEAVIEVLLSTAGKQRDALIAWLRDSGWSNNERRRRNIRKLVPAAVEPDVLSVEAVDQTLDRLENRWKHRSDLFVEKQVTTLIRRDRPLIQALKRKYSYRCQFHGCNASIPMRNGELYCEVAHLKPVAAGGQSVRLNLVVLCPNHHKLLDYGNLVIEESTRSIIKGTINDRSFTITR